MTLGALLAIATIVISIAVVVGQYAQWRAANQKVVIELHDRRLRVYTQLEKAIERVLQDGNVSQQAYNDFVIGQANARFLFGNEIQTYLNKLRDDFAWVISYTDDAIAASPEKDRRALVAKKYDCINNIAAFYDTAPDLFAPYIKLTETNTSLWRPW